MSHSDHREISKNMKARCAVVTCSDTRTEETDTSGAYILDGLKRAGHEVCGYQIVRDEPERIRALLEQYAADGLDVVLINGGTGISKRDSTYEAIVSMLEKTLPGFGELFRVISYEDIGPPAMLSRATAGVFRDMLVFSMPGSTAAVRLAMDRLILDELSHFVWEIHRSSSPVVRT